MTVQEWLQEFFQAHHIIENCDGAVSLKHQLEISEEFGYTHKPEVLTLSQWKEFWADKSKDIRDFIYEKKTGKVLVNMSYSFSHEHFMAQMYNAIKNVDLEVEDASYLFINEFGFFRSSASGYGPSNYFCIGRDYVVSPEEKLAFKEWEFNRVA